MLIWKPLLRTCSLTGANNLVNNLSMGVVSVSLYCNILLMLFWHETSPKHSCGIAYDLYKYEVLLCVLYCKGSDSNSAKSTAL